MEPAPVMRYHLEFLASRLVWSRLLPGLALIAVGMTQPFAVIKGDADTLVSSLSPGGVIGGSEFLAQDGLARACVVGLFLAALALGAQSLSAMTSRSDRARRVTIGLAIVVGVLGLMTMIAVGSVGSVEPVRAAPGDSYERYGTVALTAQGPVPLLLGSVAVWVTAARAKRPERMLERTISSV